MIKLQCVSDFFVDGKDLVVGICVYVKNVQYIVYQQVDGGYNWCKQDYNDLDDVRDVRGCCFGCGDCIGFGQNFGKDQY